MISDYECPKCHNIFPYQNKLIHDLRCTEQKPMPLDKINQINKNNKNNKKKNIIDLPGIFICDICGASLKESLKDDHMYCHSLNQEETNLDINGIKVNKEKIEQQKKIEKIIKNNLINEQKKVENQIRKKNKNELLKKQKEKKNQKKIEEQIKKQNELRNQRLAQQIQRNINNNQNNIINPNFFEPVIPNYDHPTEETILNTLPEDFIEDVTKLDNEKKICSICLEDFKNGDKVTYLPCIHFFHTYCVNNWLKSQNSCPICKFKLEKDNLII